MRLSDRVSLVLKQKGYGAFSVTPEQTVYEAVKEMANRQVGAMVVLSDDRLIGIITERDYARKIILMGRRSFEVEVKEIMSSPAIAVTPEHTVDDCMVVMTENHIRHLPVVEGREVVGIVSIGDLVKWIISAQDGQIRSLETYIAGSYPA